MIFARVRSDFELSWSSSPMITEFDRIMVGLSEPSKRYEPGFRRSHGKTDEWQAGGTWRRATGTVHAAMGEEKGVTHETGFAKDNPAPESLARKLNFGFLRKNPKRSKSHLEFVLLLLQGSGCMAVYSFRKRHDAQRALRVNLLLGFGCMVGVVVKIAILFGCERDQRWL
ncbi:hypothetical protein BGX38DRAFT_919873 [Terfezia claveryi]|nr:hypothetical protein BGX38DRAFT_919873 [Terfezia claveryi]